MSYLEANLRAIKLYQSNLFQSLKSAIEEWKLDRQGIENCSTPQNSNIRWIHPKNTFIDFLHSPNAELEAATLLSHRPMVSASLILIFAPGANALLQQVLELRKSIKRPLPVGIVEVEPALFLQSLEIYDFSAAFEDKYISWMVSSDLPRLKNQITHFYHRYRTLSANPCFYFCPAPLSLQKTSYEDLASHTRVANSMAEAAAGNSVEDALVGLKNTIENLDRALSNPGILRLKDRFKGKICISVASGPSLEAAMPVLAEIQKKIPIFAAGSALKPLLENKIEPDFVTAIERIPIVTKTFKGLKIPERTTLIAPALLLRESFEAFEGHQLIYPGISPFTEGLALDDLGFLEVGHSAGNLNLSAAHYFGFSTIILVGHNLGYSPDGISHTPGTVLPERSQAKNRLELEALSNGRRSLSQDGTTEIFTSPLYDLFRHEIESLIASSSGTRWINTTEKGARIRGAEFMTLTEAIKNYLGEPFDIHPMKIKLLSPPTGDELKRRQALARETQLKAYHAARVWKDEVNEILKKISNWKNKIRSKEIEGKTVGLSFLDSAIDEVIRIKIKATEEDPLFEKAILSVLSSYHLEFERDLNSMANKYENLYSLKRDFLLRHEAYFETYRHFLPQIEQIYQGQTL